MDMKETEIADDDDMSVEELNAFVGELLHELDFLRPAYDLLAHSHRSNIESLTRAYAQIDELRAEAAFKIKSGAH